MSRFAEMIGEIGTGLLKHKLYWTPTNGMVKQTSSICGLRDSTTF